MILAVGSHLIVFRESNFLSLGFLLGTFLFLFVVSADQKVLLALAALEESRIIRTQDLATHAAST